MNATPDHAAAAEDQPPSFAETMLQELVPCLQRSERTSADLRQMIATQARALAKERGIGFLRLEHLIKEFGK